MSIRYYGTLIVEYEVNETNYYLQTRVSSLYPFNHLLSGYSIDDKIKLVYNKKLPQKSAIDEIESYEIVLYIIGGIFLFCLIYNLYEKNWGKKKNLCLKVIGIEEIDYQTEIIFFEDTSSKKLFFIEYDFGERIKIGNYYKIDILYKYNYKKQTVMFKNENIKAYQLININKDILFESNKKE